MKRVQRRYDKKYREKREDPGMSILWNFWGLLLSWRYTTLERSYSKGEVSLVWSGVHSLRPKEDVSHETIDLWSNRCAPWNYWSMLKVCSQGHGPKWKSNLKKQKQLLTKGRNTISATQLPTPFFPLSIPHMWLTTMPKGAASESWGCRLDTGQVCVVWQNISQEILSCAPMVEKLLL